MATVNEKMTAIAEPIRTFMKESDRLTLDDMATDLNGCVEANADLESVLYGTDFGGKSQICKFWDEYTQDNTDGNLGYAFAGGSWTEKLLSTIPYPLYIWNAPALFIYNTSIEDISTLPIQGGALKIANYSSLVAYASALKKMFCIDGTLATTFYNVAKGATALESVSFVENTIKINISFEECPLLNKESIISLINGLSGDVSGKTATISLAAVNTAFETSKAEGDGSASEEFDALCNTKPNWTITLV